METEAGQEAMRAAAEMEIKHGHERIDHDKKILEAIGYKEQGA